MEAILIINEVITQNYVSLQSALAADSGITT